MPDELLTQDPSTDSNEVVPAGANGTALPDVDQGPSEVEGLPEEYKPYSMLPWNEIPEEVRDKVLSGIKSFHGGMTKQQQEFARMKADMAEYKHKSMLLDQMVNEPWVKAAWKAHQDGQSIAPVEEKPIRLDEHLDKDAASAIETMVERAIAKKLDPLSAQIGNLSQDQANVRAKQDLDILVKKAQDSGWPTPMDYFDQMSQLVASGRARSVEDAYRLATYEDFPKMVETKTRKSLQEELSKKASNSIAPRMGPGTNGKSHLYSGRDAVLKAFNDAKAEYGI
jgi:hypothetical protein